MTLLEGFALVPLAYWLLLALDRSRAWPHECRLEEAPPSGAPGESVVAIVPARDEAEVLPEALPSVLAQDHEPLAVVLVDDHSTDGTGDVARRLARETGRERRLRVVTAPDRPPGWTGKVHAMASGVAAVGAAGDAPEWFLFTDADIRHRPGSVRSLVAHAERHGFDMVSVMARLRAENFWERLLIPAFVYFFQLLFPFRRIRNPRSRIYGAAGGCVLARRAVLERAGGLAAIRSALIDDVNLGRILKGAGGRTWLGFDPGIESIRGYPDLADIWRMVARSAFDQLGYSYVLTALVFVGMMLVLVSPPLTLVLGIATGSALAIGASVAAWALSAVALYPSVRHHRVPAIYAALHPLASFFYALMTAGSAWDHFRGRGGQWKGRVHDAESNGVA
jgi:hopene-associated glycosyltransferase HpnB